MKYYLETNALLQISKISQELLSRSHTSYFSLFELISGIKNENEYNIRKLCVRRIFASNLKIVEKSPKTKLASLYGAHSFQDENIEATIALAHQLAESETLDNFLKFKYIRNNIVYSLQTYIESDLAMSNAALENSKNASTHLIKEERRKIPDLKNIIPEILDLEAPKIIIKFGIRLIGASDAFSIMHALDKYRNGYLSEYVRAITWLTLSSLKGFMMSDNDIFDIGHLVYIDADTVLVSNDKLYRRLAQAIQLNLLSIDDFLALEASNVSTQVPLQ